MLINALGCQLTYSGQVMTNAEAWFSIALRPRKPEGLLGRTAQDGHLDSLTAPELCHLKENLRGDNASTHKARSQCPVQTSKMSMFSPIHPSVQTVAYFFLFLFFFR